MGRGQEPPPVVRARACAVALLCEEAGSTLCTRRRPLARTAPPVIGSALQPHTASCRWPAALEAGGASGAAGTHTHAHCRSDDTVMRRWLEGAGDMNPTKAAAASWHRARQKAFGGCGRHCTGRDRRTCRAKGRKGGAKRWAGHGNRENNGVLIGRVRLLFLTRKKQTAARKLEGIPPLFACAVSPTLRTPLPAQFFTTSWTCPWASTTAQPAPLPCPW